MKHLLLSLSLVCILCSGCATIQTQLNAKNSLLAPASLDSPQAKQYIEDAYAVSLISAQNSTNPADITRYVSAGNAVNAMHCGDWLDLISTNKRKQVIGADNAGVLENLITAALGLAKASSTLVAGYGIAATAYSGFNNVVNTDIFMALPQYQVQTTLLTLQESCSTQLSLSAANMSFAEAYNGLKICSKTCSFEAAQGAASAALQATPVFASPKSGALAIEKKLQ